MRKPPVGAHKEADSAWTKFVLLMGFLWNFGDSGEQKSKHHFGELLVQLENSIPLNSFEDAWAMQRPAWVQQCKTATQAKQFGMLLAELAGYLLPTSMGGDWATKQKQWFVDCDRLKNWERLTELSLRLEQNICWSGMQDLWGGQKKMWKEKILTTKGS